MDSRLSLRKRSFCIFYNTEQSLLFLVYPEAKNISIEVAENKVDKTEFNRPYHQPFKKVS
jgi:hypothetical protein